MAGFNESHKSYLRATFTYVDELLLEVQRILERDKTISPFSRYLPDATPIQQKVIADCAARVRAEMLASVRAYQANSPQLNVSAVWAARCALQAAQIAIEELEPDRMRGYGELSESALKDLNGLASRLLNLLNQMQFYLAQSTAEHNQAANCHFTDRKPIQYPDLQRASKEGSTR